MNKVINVELIGDVVVIATEGYLNKELRQRLWGISAEITGIDLN